MIIRSNPTVGPSCIRSKNVIVLLRCFVVLLHVFLRVKILWRLWQKLILMISLHMLLYLVCLTHEGVLTGGWVSWLQRHSELVYHHTPSPHHEGVLTGGHCLDSRETQWIGSPSHTLTTPWGSVDRGSVSWLQGDTVSWFTIIHAHHTMREFLQGVTVLTPGRHSELVPHHTPSPHHEGVLSVSWLQGDTVSWFTIIHPHPVSYTHLTLPTILRV